MKFSAYILAALALPLIVACRENDTSVPAGDGTIRFGVAGDIAGARSGESVVSGRFFLTDGSDSVGVESSVSDGMPQPVSRGEQLTALSEFRVWAFMVGDGDARPFFAAEPAALSGTDWRTAKTYYWPTPASRKLSFTALTGYTTEGLEVNASLPPTAGANLSLTYTVPASATAQPDIMLATTDAVNGCDNPDYRVPLAFKHICTAVRIVAGTPMIAGTIESVRLCGVLSTGTYADGAWTELGVPAVFSYGSASNPASGTTGNEADGDPLLPAAATFMLLPQTLGDDATMEVVFRDRIAGTTRTLSASLAGQQWPMGKTTTYHLGITPEFEIEFTEQPPVQDAHYVMCNTAIDISGLQPQMGWTLTASACDGADVSVQRESDVNEFVRQGFWLDRLSENGTISNESARGTAILKGSGNASSLPVRVFIPENIGEAPRTVTLRLQVDGYPESMAKTIEISQLNPAWSGSTGWEQFNDGDAAIYGFCYDARHVYYTPDGWRGYAALMVRNLISNYNAASYASVTTYQVLRSYVDIDYRKLNALDGKAVSTTDGLQNTRELFVFGGTAATRNFENSIASMQRILVSGTVYVKRDSNAPSNVPQWIEGTEIDRTQLLAQVLKKNRYYLNTQSDESASTTAPMIRTEDIVWYLPAWEQYGSAPQWHDGSAMDGGDYWSSTASSGIASYLGNGSVAERTVMKMARVARNR